MNLSSLWKSVNGERIALPCQTQSQSPEHNQNHETVVHVKQTNTVHL